MRQWKSIAEIRREYGSLSLSEDQIPDSPITQFEAWFAEVLQVEKNDPTAMVLSTVDEQGHPDSRVVLLKGIDDGDFIFYTNYQSAKAQHIKAHPQVALNFFWPEMARQVRIQGVVERVSAVQSDAYFSSRPSLSQLSAIVSHQSQILENRAQLEQRLNALIAESQQALVVRPEHWGGYRVIPHRIEFWQGRDNRLHDRINYVQESGIWTHHRLAP